MSCWSPVMSFNQWRSTPVGMKNKKSMGMNHCLGSSTTVLVDGSNDCDIGQWWKCMMMVREASPFQNRWIFGKVPNGLWLGLLSLKAWKSEKVGKSRIKSEKSDLIFYQTFGKKRYLINGDVLNAESEGSAQSHNNCSQTNYNFKMLITPERKVPQRSDTSQNDHKSKGYPSKTSAAFTI